MDAQNITGPAKATAEQIKNDKPKHKVPYSHPFRFSYPDLLALIFISVYFFLILYGTFFCKGDENTREFIKSMVSNPLLVPIVAIMGFYYGQQVLTSYFMSKSNTYGSYMGMSTMYDPYMMNGYGMNTMMNQSAVQQTVNQGTEDIQNLDDK
jgi:hypothetical protein